MFRPLVLGGIMEWAAQMIRKPIPIQPPNQTVVTGRVTCRGWKAIESNVVPSRVIRGRFDD